MHQSSIKTENLEGCMFCLCRIKSYFMFASVLVSHLSHAADRRRVKNVPEVGSLIVSQTPKIRAYILRFHTSFP